jgi:hypothetical protein
MIPCEYICTPIRAGAGKRHDFVPPTLKQSPSFAHARRRLFPLSTRQSKTSRFSSAIIARLQISAAGAAWCSSEGGFEIANWPHLEAWARRLKAMPGFALPYDLIPSKDREFDPV